MRTGAIFARGSCRVFKWMALFGVVVALGAGQGLAQQKIADGTVISLDIASAVERTINGVKREHVQEGEITTFNVTLRWTHAQVTDAWDGGTVRPDNAVVPVTITPLQGDDGQGNANNIPQPWLSAAEVGATGHQDDVVLPANAMVQVRVPAAPTSNTTSTVHTLESTGSISITFSQDPDAEDEGFMLALEDKDSEGVAIDTMTPQSIPRVVIEDDESQGISLTRMTKGTVWEGGGSQTFEAEAEPSRVDLPLRVRYDLTDSSGVSVSSRTYSLDESIGTIAPGAGMKDTVVLNVAANDGNREDDALEMHAEVVSLSLASGAFDNIESDSIAFTVVDIHKLPLVEFDPEMGMVEEGDTIELTLMVDRNPRNTIVTDDEERQYTLEEISVMLSMAEGTTADATDYRIMTNPVTIAKHSGKASDGWIQEMKVEVMALEDDVLDPDEMLMLVGEVSGTVAANGSGSSMTENMAALTIEEGTAKYVWAKTEEEIYAALMAAMGEGDFNPGMSFEVMGSALFNAAEGVTLGFTAESDLDHVATTSVSGGMVMVTAGDEAGMAAITVTAHASMPSRVTILDQTDPREASVQFPVEVKLAPLTIMLEGPEEMNLAEGGMGGMVTATASRMVTEDTMVTLMRDRAMSSASDEDYMAEPITILAGQMSGSTMVMAVEDNMAEDMEELVLYAMAGDMDVEGEIKFYIWDAAVPALPIIAQLLLAAFLTIGGCRRYLRR